MILERKIEDIPPQMKILNIIIPFLMYFCSLVSNWSFASRIKPHVIQQNVTKLMTSSYFGQYTKGYDVIQTDVALHLQVH